MTDSPAELADLIRERDQLVEDIKKDNDWYGRDHLPTGRWPMVHAISRRINIVKRDGNAN